MKRKKTIIGKNDRKIMIVGRSGSGKDTLAALLTNRFGMDQLCSTTTRPRRYEGEATHVFVSEEEANLMTERVAETVIDGYQYFATKGQFEECDIYVIDPRGLECVCENAQDTELCVVYVNASHDTRLNRAKKRADDPELAEKVFESRHSDENAMFEDFESYAYSDADTFAEKYPTAKVIVTIGNDEDDIARMERIAAQIATKAYQDTDKPVVIRY